MSASSIVFICGGVGFALGLLLMVVADVTYADNWLFYFGAGLALISTIALPSAVLVQDAENERADRKTNDLVRKACYPSVATNIADSDGYKVFDCADDGRLRRVKSIQPR